MIKFAKIALLAAAAAAMPACSSVGGDAWGLSSYESVRVSRVQVGDGKMSVAAPRPYNRYRARRFDDIVEVEDWTLNGPLLDGISFVTGLKSGRYLVRQQKSSDQQVPKFREDMTAPEIAAMLESLYRVRGGALEFKTLSLQPRAFAGVPGGFQFDFEHLDGDELWRKGRAVGAVSNGRLYLILMDAAKSHYYAEVLPDFEAIASSARIRG